MPHQQHQLDALKERQVNLTIKALKQDPKLSQQHAAAIYRVPQKTISNRRAGRPSHANSIANSRALDNNKEQVIVKYILYLVKQGFPPRLLAVANMANSLRAERSLGYISLN
jgi:hypothetical protein